MLKLEDDDEERERRRREEERRRERRRREEEEGARFFSAFLSLLRISSMLARNAGVIVGGICCNSAATPRAMLLTRPTSLAALCLFIFSTHRWWMRLVSLKAAFFTLSSSWRASSCAAQRISSDSVLRAPDMGMPGT
jgi:ABC-type multidrug transport system fused ATPase/permease subunit